VAASPACEVADETEHELNQVFRIRYSTESMKLLAINRSAAMVTLAALADRGFIGVATFAATVLLGRWAGPEELGLFALFTPAVFVAIALEESLITAPYTFFAARQAERDERQDYLGSVLVHTGVLSAVMAVLFAVTSLVTYLAGWSGFVAAAAILAPVVPCVLLREFARRVVYAELRPTVAAWISGGVSVIQLGLMALLHVNGRLNAVTAFAAMGISSLIGGAVWLYRNREEIDFRPTGVKAAFARNWFISKWTTATQLGEVVRVQMFPWLLAVALDERNVGIYAACAAIATLSGPLQIALSNLLLPQFAAAEDKGGVAAADRLMWQATAWITLVMAAFTLTLACLSAGLVPWIYGPEYVGTQTPLVLLLLAQLVAAAAMPAARALVALQRPNLDFVCQASGIILNLAAGVPLVIGWGISGAALSGLLAAIIKAALTAVFYKGEVRRRLATCTFALALNESDSRAAAIGRRSAAVRRPVISAAAASSWSEEPS
jgi:O-antigen/teichoic acid export membrane protein